MHLRIEVWLEWTSYSTVNQLPGQSGCAPRIEVAEDSYPTLIKQLSERKGAHPRIEGGWGGLLPHS
jgi:hypothetical protein